MLEGLMARRGHGGGHTNSDAFRRTDRPADEGCDFVFFRGGGLRRRAPTLIIQTRIDIAPESY
jgi:hypothetical protein